MQGDDLAAIAELVAADLAEAVQTVALLRTMSLQQTLATAGIEARIALRNTKTATLRVRRHRRNQCQPRD
jgi:hypothetical protein